jgi:DNA-binding NarL/FixJ family response regulator
VEYQKHSIPIDERCVKVLKGGDVARRVNRMEEMFIEVLDDALYSGMADEDRVVELQERGFTRKQIADEMNVSVWTVGRMLGG